MILEARGLKRYYARGGSFMKPSGMVRAVDGVDLAVQKGETLGLVGESGCGKSTLARLFLRLEDPDAGELYFKGKRLGHVSNEFRCSVQGVFQDPYGTLNPRFTVHQSMEEGLRNLVKGMDHLGRRRRMVDALDAVGLQADILERYPHEFSGGQRQRIGIARVLVLEPELLICDEPVSSLDVSIAAQIITLLKRIKEARGMALILISHHMGLVSALADRIAVMKKGQIVECGPARQVIMEPHAPYTQALMEAVPRLERSAS